MKTVMQSSTGHVAWPARLVALAAFCAILASEAFADEDAEIVKAAILQTKQKIDDGKIITNCPRYTTGTIQRMKGDKAQAQAAAEKTKSNNSAMLRTDPSFRLQDYLPKPYDPNDPNDTRGELPDDNETWI